MWQEFIETNRPAGGPCGPCAIGSSVAGRLHPLAEQAVEIHGMLNGGPAGQEAYRLRTIEIGEDVFDLVTAPLMAQWAAECAEIDAEERKNEIRRATDKYPTEVS